MGTSTNAMLLYGYHLGDDDGGWQFQEAGEVGELPVLEWYDPNAEDEDGEMLDFIQVAEKRLLAVVAGFTETDWRAPGYHERKRAAKQRLGVEFESHAHSDYPMWVLTAQTITAHRGDIHLIDPERLAAEPAENGWDDRLAAAVRALGLTPKQPRPAWLLCSYWG